MNIPHGEFSITVIDSVVYAESSSGVNLEGVVRFFHLLSEQTKDLETWVLCFHARENAGATPDALEYSMKTIRSLTQEGCLGMVSRVETKLMLHLSKELYRNSGINHLISDDEAEIEAFIKTLFDEAGSNDF